MAELSGLEVLALVKEIGAGLRGTYVNNIFSIGEAQIFRFREPGGGDVWLVVSPSKGMWVSEKVTERSETTEFTSNLRGELGRAKFIDAAQVGLDRIFELRFGVEDSVRKLTLELMPPGNIIVSGEDGRILLVKDEVRSPRRRVVRGVTYSPPAQSRLSPALIREDDVREMAATEKTVGKAIGKHVSIPRKYVAEVAHRLSLTEEAPSSSLAGMESRVVEVILDLVREAREKPRACLCETNLGDEIFAVRPGAFMLKREAPSVSALCDELFLVGVVEKADAAVDPVESKRRELEATISRLKSEEAAQLAEASKARSSAAGAAAAATVSEARKILEGLELNTKKELSSPASVASFLYDRAKELEARASEASDAARRLAKRTPGVTTRKTTTKRLPWKKREWYEKFRWFYTGEGKLAIGGRDAHSNSILVRRHMEDGDSVFHADLFGSPFFILKGGKDQSDEEIREVAQNTVAFSSAWKTGLGSADAYWVTPDQVSTAAPSGEYLARGSFSIKGKKNFVTKNFVEVAVGLDKAGKVTSGPEAALKDTSACYVVLRPHREKGSETAKKVLAELRGMAKGGALDGVSVDDVLRALPAGGGRVVRRVDGTKADRRRASLAE